MKDIEGFNVKHRLSTNNIFNNIISKQIEKMLTWARKNNYQDKVISILESLIP